MRHTKHSGQALTEYLILVLLISIVSISVVKSIGSTLQMKLRVTRDRILKEVAVDD